MKSDVRFRALGLYLQHGALRCGRWLINPCLLVDYTLPILVITVAVAIENLALAVALRYILT